MRLRSVFWKWAVFGLLFAGFLTWAQANAVGGVAGMLQVGETSGLRPLIEAQLGDVPLAPGPGHDGQIYYAIALDLDGDDVAPLLDHAAYRYRRILFPLVGSAFGLLEGFPLLLGLITVNVISFAVACGAVAALSHRAARSELLALTVLLNPGAWLSVQLLTSDILAVMLMILALGMSLHERRWSSGGLFGLSVLAKDVFLATPVPYAAAEHRSRWPLAAVPIAAMVIWMAVLSLLMGDGFAARGNLDWPLMGLIGASANWGTLEFTEWLYLVTALGFVGVGAVLSFRETWLRWPIAAWTALGLVSSNWVWDFGNNAVRAFTPIAILAALAWVHTSEDATPPGAVRTTAGT